MKSLSLKILIFCKYPFNFKSVFKKKKINKKVFEKLESYAFIIYLFLKVFQC